MTRRTLYRLQIFSAILWTGVFALTLWKMHEGHPGGKLTVIISGVVAAVTWWSIPVIRRQIARESARDPDTK
jgi:hypothetical protein